jgi:hypothetical protein
MLIEKHNRKKDKEINCSYCKDLAYHSIFSFGFWTPIDKSFNSWWVFWFVGRENNYYLRFTLPFLKRPKVRFNP